MKICASQAISKGNAKRGRGICATILFVPRLRFGFRFGVIILLLLSYSFESRADDEGSDKKSTKLRKLIDESIDWFQIYSDVDSTEAMKPITIMRWPNSVRGSTDGASVIWINNGRPEVIAAIYPWESKLFCHEFESLSRVSVVARRDGELVWQPSKPGLEFRAMADAAVPSDKAAARLRQMKQLAKQFTSTLLGWKADDSQREELRLVPRPLYVYEIEKPNGVMGGALFAFATGTDPESILVLEAVEIEGSRRWEYAFVRRSSGKLEGRFRDELVWTAKRFPSQKDIHSTHIQFNRKLDEVLE